MRTRSSRTSKSCTRARPSSGDSIYWGRGGETFYRKFPPPLPKTPIPSSSKTFDWWGRPREGSSFRLGWKKRQDVLLYCERREIFPSFFVAGNKEPGDWRSRGICGVTGALCRPLSRVKGRFAPVGTSPPEASYGVLHELAGRTGRYAVRGPMRSGQGGVGCSQHRVRTEPPRAGQSGQPARRAEPSGPPRGAGVVRGRGRRTDRAQKIARRTRRRGAERQAGRRRGRAGAAHAPLRQRVCGAGHPRRAGPADPGRPQEPHAVPQYPQHVQRTAELGRHPCGQRKRYRVGQ